MEIPVLNKSGEQVSTLAIDEQTLGGEINPDLIKQAFVMYHANQRQGSARTKSRGMVEGSTRKLYKQKGTGNARVGSARTVIRRGGGMAFAKTKTREDYRVSMPVKMRRKANRNALLSKLIDNEVRVVEDLDFDSPKTKAFSDLLIKLNIDRSCVVAVSADNLNARLAARNLEVELCNSDQLTCWELLNHRYLVIARADLEAWLAGPSSKTDKSASRSRKTKAAAGEAK